MLKKMRLRFIAAAMTASGVVMFTLFLGINLLNYSVTTARQNKMLDGIMEYEQMKLTQPEDCIPMIADLPWADGPEADFTTRFFAVHCDERDHITDISREHISSVDIETIYGYTGRILSGNRMSGLCDNYRYLVRRDEAGSTVIFLDISGNQRFIRSLLLVSVVITLASLIVVFLLVVFFSGRAIRPYMKNIERQKQFITDAGHELKTPLTSISTSADILAMEDGDNEWVANIQKQTARLTLLVRDLVALSRLDEETPFPEKADFSVSDAAWETAEPFASLAKAAGRQYSQRIEEHVNLTGDRQAVQQLLSILLDNAVRYSDEGGEIRLDIYRRHNRVYIEVFNTCGLLETADLNRLFDRFYRPDQSRSVHTGGTGIGLSMAQAIAEAHGGKITAGSPDKKSILFKAVLPNAKVFAEFSQIISGSF